jgi:glycosyltransferase involved in cell wall biosynthesis
MKGIFRCLGEDTEIILVVDGSERGDRNCIQTICRRSHSVHAIFHSTCLGKGASIRDGVRIARGSIIAFTDADMVIHPRFLLRAYREITRTRSMDMIIARRSKYETHLLRKILSCAFRCINAMLFGFPLWDTQAALKVFRAPVAHRLFSSLTVGGYAFDVELLALARARRYRIREVPVEQVYTKYSSMSFLSALNMLVDTIHIYHESVRRSLRPCAAHERQYGSLPQHLLMVPLSWVVLAAGIALRSIITWGSAPAKLGQGKHFGALAGVSGRA